jgi:hypothetical protein
MRLVRAAVVLALLAVGIAGCGSDDDEAAGWAIVKVEIVDGPALASICIDSICQEFDPDSPVRSGEFSAYVEPRSTFEVLRVGEPSGEGASGGSRAGVLSGRRSNGSLRLGPSRPSSRQRSSAERSASDSIRADSPIGREAILRA